VSAGTTASAAWLRWQGSVRRALGWWGRNLATWLPPMLRLALCERPWLRLQVQAQELRLLAVRAQTVRELATLPVPLPASTPEQDGLARLLREDVARWPRQLQLPAMLGLRRSLPLPVAARARLREVLAFEIERQTPFSAADVLYAGRVLGERQEGQLQVELVVLPRHSLDAVLARWGIDGARLMAIDLYDAQGQALGVNLLPPAQRYRARDPWRVWNLALAGLAVLALLFGLTQLLENRRAAAAELQSAMTTREAQARQVALQRQQLLDVIDGGAWLRAQRNGRPSVVEVMDALAQRLPDGTYLEKLSIDGDQLTLIGLSNQAAALVGKLEGAPQWNAPALSGALQQDPRTRMDRFTLVAQLRHQTPATADRGAAP